MAKSVAEKLRMLPGTTALVLEPPPGYLEVLDAPVAISTEPERASYDVVQLFVTGAAQLRAQLDTARPVLRPGGILWVSYPKLTSKTAGELNRDVLFELMQGHGFQAVAQVAVDDTWSAMRFKPR